VTWTSRSPRPGLPVAEVRVWRVDLDADRGPDASSLGKDEQRRADRVLSPVSRRRWVSSRLALRSLLAGHLGLEPAEVVLSAGPTGKPVLADGALRFNLSHSGRWALIAVSDREVGVDVERIDVGRDVLRLAGRALGPEIAAQVAAAPRRDRADLFHRAWARTEAQAKCFGAGLSGWAPVRPATVTDLCPGAGWAAALAVEGEPLPIHCFELVAQA